MACRRQKKAFWLLFERSEFQTKSLFLAIEILKIVEFLYRLEFFGYFFFQEKK
jgi:hypothetical protein